MGEVDAGDIASELARQLAAEAEYVADGVIEIDAEQALAKLGRYQLSDPYTYVLRLTEAGVRLGAVGVWFWTRANSLVAHIDGGEQDLSLEPERLDKLLEVLVGERPAEFSRREALVQLAVALNAARVQLEPEQLWLDSVGLDGRGHRLMLEGGQTRRVPLAGGEPGLWLRIQDKATLGAWLGKRPEAKLLLERARWSWTPIALDDYQISQGFSLPSSVPIHGDSGRIGVAVVSRRDATTPACAVLCVAGIEVERVHPEGGRPGYFALVEAGLPRDLGYARFARGPAFDALIARVMSVQHEAAKLVPARGSLQKLSKTRRGKLAVGTGIAFEAIAVLVWMYGISIMSEGLILFATFCMIMFGPVAMILGTAIGNTHSTIAAIKPQPLPKALRRKPVLALPALEAPRALPPASPEEPG